MSITTYTPRPGQNNAAPSFVMDINSLQQLRQQVAGKLNTSLEAIEKGEKEVAQQFEALFIQTLMKQARSSHFGNGVFDNDQTRLVQSMADEQVSLELAQGKGIGLAQALLEQIQASRPDAATAGTGLVTATATTGTQAGTHVDISNKSVDSIGKFIKSLADQGSTVRKSLSNTVAAAGKMSQKVRDFIDTMAPAAYAAAAESGIPASLILSQAALESGWGKREIMDENGQTSHNLFGIKATGNWSGKVVHVMTTEYINGVARKVQQPFRAYDSYEESFTDYAALISNNKRYRHVPSASNGQEAAREIQKAGYATDPQYASKLISIMAYFNDTQQVATNPGLNPPGTKTAI